MVQFPVPGAQADPSSRGQTRCHRSHRKPCSNRNPAGYRTHSSMGNAGDFLVSWRGPGIVALRYPCDGPYPAYVDDTAIVVRLFQPDTHSVVG